MASSPKKLAPPAFVQDEPLAPAVEAVEAVETAAPGIKAEATKAMEAPTAAAKDLRENVRSIFEKGIAESRVKYAQAKTAAEEASAAVEASYGAARHGVIEFNIKTIEAFKASADANFDLVKALASAKSMSDVVTLQSEFARKRFEEAAAQAKALAELARKVADETVAPIKAHVAKTFKVAV